VVQREPGPGLVPAQVRRVLSLGFEVRLDLDIDGTDAWAQLSRSAAAELAVGHGDTVHVRPLDLPRQQLRLGHPSSAPARAVEDSAVSEPTPA